MVGKPFLVLSLAMAAIFGCYHPNAWADRIGTEDLKLQQESHFKEAVACKVSEDCVLIRMHCGAIESYNKEFAEKYQKRINEQSVYVTCSKSGFVAGDRAPDVYEAKCVKNICKAKKIEKSK